MAARIGTKEDVNKFVNELKCSGAEIIKTEETIIGIYNQRVVFRALEKGKNQPWIMMFLDSPEIQWNFPNG